MQKSLTLPLFGFGLVLVSAGAAFAKPDIPHVYVGPTTHLFNVNTSRLVPAENTDRAGDGANPLVAASHQAQNSHASATSNMSGATLAGALTLLLLQRRRRADNVLRLRH